MNLRDPSEIHFHKFTGGKFNFTTIMDFPQTGHHVVIEHRFHGVDVFNYLRTSVNIHGTVPSIPYGSKIEIPDYEEEHVKTGLGSLFLYGKVCNQDLTDVASQVNSSRQAVELSVSRDLCWIFHLQSRMSSTLRNAFSPRCQTRQCFVLKWPETLSPTTLGNLSSVSRWQTRFHL